MTTADRPPPEGDTDHTAAPTLGPYRVLGVLGRGGSSEVLRVERGGRTLALKWLLERHSQSQAQQVRFQQEAVLLRDLDLPGLVRVEDEGVWRGRPYLVMEHLPGALPAGPLPVARVLALALPLAQTLQALHQRGIVHRDIKPQNILLTAAGAPRLIDLGLAKLTSEDPEDRFATQSGVFLGTRGYAAPEQRLSSRGCDDRADIYALGLVLFQLLSGHLPFAADSEDVPLWAEAPSLAARAPFAPAALCALVQAMLRRDRERRPRAAAVVARLVRISAHPGPTRAERLRAPRRLLLALPLLWCGLSGRPCLDDFDAALEAAELPLAAAYLAGASDRDALPERRWQKEADLLLAQGQPAAAAARYRQAFAAGQQREARGGATADALRRQSINANGEGDARMHLQDLDGAEERYRRSLELHEQRYARGTASSRGDETALTRYRLALLLRERGQEEAARKELTQARSLLERGATPAAERARQLARIAEALGDGGTAEREAALAVRLRPSSWKARLALWRTRVRFGSAAQAQAALAEVARLQAAHPEHGELAHEALLLLRLGQERWPGTRSQEIAALLVTLRARAQWLGDRHLTLLNAAPRQLARSAR